MESFDINDATAQLVGETGKGKKQKPQNHEKEKKTPRRWKGEDAARSDLQQMAFGNG